MTSALTRGLIVGLFLSWKENKQLKKMAIEGVGWGVGGGDISLNNYIWATHYA